MRQVSEAREAQKRAEDQLAKAVQRGERLGVELEGLRAQTAAQALQVQRAAQDHQAAATQAAQAQAERDALMVQLATRRDGSKARSSRCASGRHGRWRRRSARLPGPGRPAVDRGEAAQAFKEVGQK
jgi:hypothetical protein